MSFAAFDCSKVSVPIGFPICVGGFFAGGGVAVDYKEFPENAVSNVHVIYGTHFDINCNVWCATYQRKIFVKAQMKKKVVFSQHLHGSKVGFLIGFDICRLFIKDS